MPSTSNWHLQVASILIEAIDSGELPEISLFRLVPLSNKKWVTPKGAAIFLPTTGGIEVPTDLKLSLIDANSITHPTRAKLFKKLGVTECEASRIFPLIKQFYDNSGSVPHTTHISHLKFLFWHHDQLPQGGAVMKALSSNGSLFWPSVLSIGWVYNPDGQGEYAACKHLGNAAAGELKSQIQILHSLYSQHLFNIGRRNEKTAPSWVYEYFGAKASIQLHSRANSNAISPEFRYIIEKRPEILLGTLEANLFQYKIAWSPIVGKCNIPILHSTTKKPLGKTILPAPKLVSIVERLGLKKDFGFIKELEGLTDATAGRWYFLEQFGVVKDDGFSFWLAMIEQAKRMRCQKVDVIAEIYRELQNVCRADIDKQILM
jgi:hypothetical protein